MTKTTKGVQLPLLGGWARNLAAGDAEQPAHAEEKPKRKKGGK